MPTIGVEAVTPTEEHDKIGNSDVDALFSGYKYSQDIGANSTTVTYSFPTSDSIYSDKLQRGYGTEDAEPYSGLEGVSSSVQTHFKTAVGNLEQFSNFVGQLVPDEGDSAGTIRLAWTSFKEDEGDDTVAWAYLPGAHFVAGDIWLQSDILSETSEDFAHTLFHELGHAIGLKHPFEEENGFPTLDASLEGADYTVMSYTVSARFPDATWADLWPQTYMYLDIKALQELYGADMVTTGGADTYNFDFSNRYYQTIWDASGTDTLSVSGGAKDVHLNLASGSWSNVGTTIEYHDGSKFFTDGYTVYIADDTLLEDATGASGDDTLEGNDAGNWLKGNDGDDVIIGGAGSDVLAGHAGSDVQFGGDGNDQLWAGQGDLSADTMVGGAGDDVAGGRIGDDLIVGGGFDEGDIQQLSKFSESAIADGRDTLYGLDGDDTIIGGGWDDGAVADNGRFDIGEQVVSGQDDNVLWSGDGNDLVYGAAGNDIIGGRDGADTIHAGGGDDTVYGGSSSHGDLITGGAGNDELFSGPGNDEVDGGDGADLIFDGPGNDNYSGGGGGDTFIFSGSGGVDIISDFDVLNDTLDFSDGSSSFSTSSDVSAAAATQNGGILIDLGGGDSLFLDGISLNDVATINYEF